MTKHPAKYNDKLLPVFDSWLASKDRVLDPFAGTGKLKNIRPDAICMDIEPEWGAMSGLQADALVLPFGDNTFDAICTSPTYGNRMADHHNAKDGSKRNTYTHTIGHQLHANNSGKMQWGDKYISFHERAWQECRRVLCKGGLLILNMKDHIRKGEREWVTSCHVETLMGFGFEYLDYCTLELAGNRYGANSDKRVDYESVHFFCNEEETF